MVHSTSRKAHMAGVAFATIFGLSFMFSKIALANVTAMGLIAYRFLFAFLGFLLLRLTGIVRIRLKREHVPQMMLVALFQPILYFVFETYGLTLLTSAEAGMMIALIPIFVSILSGIFLKERPLPLQVVFIILSVSGVIFIQIMSQDKLGASPPLGYVLLFCAVLSAAFFNIFSRKSSKTMKPEALTYFMMLSSAIFFNAVYLIQLGWKGQIENYFIHLSKVEVVGPLLYLGLMASIGGFFLVNYCLARLPAHISSIYANVSTIIAIAAGALILSEELAYYHYIGSAMILIGVYGTIVLNQRKQPNHIPIYGGKPK
ncbi:MAG: DMT family transporter [Candidatus Izemoplasmatales bacterium]|nr:DMT family transporter [Candidatus Izemoplasmatales bacterium]